MSNTVSPGNRRGWVWLRDLLSAAKVWGVVGGFVGDLVGVCGHLSVSDGEIVHCMPL